MLAAGDTAEGATVKFGGYFPGRNTLCQNGWQATPTQ